MNLRQAAHDLLVYMDGYDTDYPEAAPVFEALRQALAEPERKPLTDEKLEAMAEAHVTNCYFNTLTYARAIERAHGITGETNV